MRRVGKGIGALVVMAAALWVLVANFATSESRMSCPGQLSRTSGSAPPFTTPATLYARVEAFRWFVFWTNYDAMIYWEVQPGGASDFGYYRNSPFAAVIVDFEGTKIRGSWSSLSSQIRVDTVRDGVEAFEGICQ